MTKMAAQQEEKGVRIAPTNSHELSGSQSLGVGITEPQGIDESIKNGVLRKTDIVVLPMVNIKKLVGLRVPGRLIPP